MFELWNEMKDNCETSKYIVCYSGGHSSAISAVETVRKYGKKRVVLLNHNISSTIEHEDIKRFKREVSEYLDVPITYANIEEYEKNTPIEVCRKIGYLTNITTQQALCTTKIKTEPFEKWLKEHYNESDVIVYGFDKNERHRIQRRSQILGVKGYNTDYPLATWNTRTIENIEEIGINRPVTYKIFKHANCIGCLKAGQQHWYVVYCLRQDIFEDAIKFEKEIGYSIIKGHFLEDLIPRFKETQLKGICPNDKENPNTFWANVNRILPEQIGFMPCDCALV